MAASDTPHTKTTLFIDKLSQPSRAVLWFCLNEQIPDFEVKYVQIRKSEQRSPEFLKMYVCPLLLCRGFGDQGGRNARDSSGNQNPVVASRVPRVLTHIPIAILLERFLPSMTRGSASANHAAS
jgi:hypothetical protein